jgi:hypothetical protein
MIVCVPTGPREGREAAPSAAVLDAPSTRTSPQGNAINLSNILIIIS